MTRVITFGTFDVFHVGHLRILKRARELGDELYVGVSTDLLNFEKKGRRPIFSEAERTEIIGALAFVDHVFLEHSLDEKKRYIEQFDADVLVMGSDWLGKFDHLGDVCTVRYLERTPSISTTALIETIKSD